MQNEEKVFMKKLFLVLPLLAVISGCGDKVDNPPKLEVPTPSEIALQATEGYFDLNVQVLEHTNDQTSPIKQFTTTFQDNTCDVDVDSVTLKVVKMSCAATKTKSLNDELDQVLTPKGKEALQKSQEAL